MSEREVSAGTAMSGSAVAASLRRRSHALRRWLDVGIAVAVLAALLTLVPAATSFTVQTRTARRPPSTAALRLRRQTACSSFATDGGASAGPAPGAAAVPLRPRSQLRPHAFLASAAAALATAALRLSRPGARPGRTLGRVPRVAAADAEVAKPASKDMFVGLAGQSVLFLLYCLLQSSMGFYMKWVLSKVQVAENLVGVPASFLVTASQQVVGFLLFSALIAVSWLIGRPYKPKALASNKEYLLVLALSLSFSLNIGLNLLSLSLVPLSLTMIVRACTPLTTSFVQMMVMRQRQNISAGEWACMSVGVLCATAVVIAQSGGSMGSASFTFFFGVAMSILSLFCGGLDFAFKGVLGSSVKLNALDTTCYMALPAAFFTSLIGFFVSKPVSDTWALQFAPRMTDLEVFGRLWQVNPAIFGWVALSGCLAFVYNTFVTFLIVKLSPATTAFAGNFNKAATILFSLLLLEGTLATGFRGRVVLAAVLGNIAAFSFYNVLKSRRQSRR
mmetsp:Transcript_121734/g.344320  ORF Transcript_121734/g.344320 Transcript_121734/m.344320 type:complete len:504 (+) Transcript_121734:2-1513(+)